MINIKNIFRATIIVFFLLPLGQRAYPQTAVEDLSAGDPGITGQGQGELFTEKIIRISRSKRVFLLTSESQKLGLGDFISLLKNQELVTRALVAKAKDNITAIKILKIYSMKLWNTLGPNSEVQILRGDDSYYVNLKNAPTKKTEEQKELEEGGAILTEEDLFSTTGLDGDSLDEKGNRAIRPDNIIGVAYGQIASLDSDNSTQRYDHWGAHWAYQMADNIWGEFYYGQSTLKAFPSEDLDTTLTNLTFRGKYTISAPMYMYVLPYIGYQILSASSPNAGAQKEDGTISQEELDREAELVTKVEKNSVIFGMTVLKRLVPGWFLKADIGTDIINFGFSIEF